MRPVCNAGRAEILGSPTCGRHALRRGAQTRRRGGLGSVAYSDRARLRPRLSASCSSSSRSLRRRPLAHGSMSPRASSSASWRGEIVDAHVEVAGDDAALQRVGDEARVAALIGVAARQRDEQRGDALERVRPPAAHERLLEERDLALDRGGEARLAMRAFSQATDRAPSAAGSSATFPWSPARRTRGCRDSRGRRDRRGRRTRSRPACRRGGA